MGLEREAGSQCNMPTALGPFEDRPSHRKRMGIRFVDSLVKSRSIGPNRLLEDRKFPTNSVR